MTLEEQNVLAILADAVNRCREEQNPTRLARRASTRWPFEQFKESQQVTVIGFFACCESPIRDKITATACQEFLSHMKKALLLVAGLAILVVGFIASGPFIAIHDISGAIKGGDSERLSGHVDFIALRASVKEQLNARVMKKATAPESNPFAALGMALASNFIDRMVDSFITPTGLANIMAGHEPQQPQQSGASSESSANAQPFQNARYTYDGLSKFSAWVKNRKGEEVRFVFTRNLLTWKLSNILIPATLFEQGASASVTPKEPKAITTMETAAIGDSLSLKGNEEGVEMRVTVVQLTYPAPPKNALFGFHQGSVLAGVQIRLENTGTLAYSDSPGNGAKMIDSQDQQYDQTIFETSAGPSIGSVKIAPGDRRVGYLLFEVPNGTQLKTFQFTLDGGYGPETGYWTLSGYSEKKRSATEASKP